MTKTVIVIMVMSLMLCIAGCSKSEDKHMSANRISLVDKDRMSVEFTRPFEINKDKEIIDEMHYLCYPVDNNDVLIGYHGTWDSYDDLNRFLDTQLKEITGLNTAQSSHTATKINGDDWYVDSYYDEKHRREYIIASHKIGVYKNHDYFLYIRIKETGENVDAITEVSKYAPRDIEVKN